MFPKQYWSIGYMMVAHRQFVGLYSIDLFFKKYHPVKINPLIKLSKLKITGFDVGPTMYNGIHMFVFTGCGQTRGNLGERARIPSVEVVNCKKKM